MSANKRKASTFADQKRAEAIVELKKLAYILEPNDKDETHRRLQEALKGKVDREYVYAALCGYASSVVRDAVRQLS